MLARARQILVSELVFALNVDEEAADARLDDVLQGRDDPAITPKKRPTKAKAAPRKALITKPAAKPKAAVKKAPAKKAPAKKAAAAKKSR
jgi:hypothetical protein